MTVPTGVPAVTVSVANVNSSNPNKVVVTYQFTAPGGTWDATDNGAYVVNMTAGEVTDANGSVPAGPLATFLALVPRTLTVTTLADTGTGSLRDMITQPGVWPTINDWLAKDPIRVSEESRTSGGARTNAIQFWLLTEEIGVVFPPELPPLP